MLFIVEMFIPLSCGRWDCIYVTLYSVKKPNGCAIELA